MAEKLDIELCLGSACYARGNGEALVSLTRYIEEKGLADRVYLHGSLCNNNCKNGPMVKINGITYTSMDAPALIELIRRQTERIET
jgi:NADH:ubiquinone oxidoreductase subunit E